MRRMLFQTHIWLGWMVGIQLFLWMLSGLVMSALPIGQVRGEHLKQEAVPKLLAGGRYLPPELALAQVPDASELTLAYLLDKPVYRLADRGRTIALLDAASGAPVRIDKALAARIASARYAGPGTIEAVRHVPDGTIVGEFRRDSPAYAVHFDDPEGSVFYVHAQTGDLAAVRTDRWRLFDLMWGLHIMDWRGREDFNHPLLIGAAALGTITVLGGIGLLLFRLRRQKGGALPIAQV